MDAIREIIGTLYVDDIITDYEILPDGDIKVSVGGDTLHVGPDLDPEHPELHAEARGYIWALYDGDTDDAVDCGGDDTVDTLAATIKRLARKSLMQNISNLDIDDPNAIIAFIWAGTDNAGQPTYYQGVEDTNAAVGTEKLCCEVGYDPNEDGVLWVIGSVESDDSIEALYRGGWAPGDRETAEREIAGIITTMNGGTVAEWQPSPEEQALIAAIEQRNAEYIASLLADRR